MFTETNFWELVTFLKRNGYTVTTERYDKPFYKELTEISNRVFHGQTAYVYGRNIRGLFSFVPYGEQTPNYYSAWNRLTADNAKCFNKHSQNPMILKLPADFDEVLRQLVYLATPEAKKMSQEWNKGFGILSYDKWQEGE
jgi:hypothetical protein